MPLEKVLLNCYHKGCGLKYDPDENTEKSCSFHPGAPYFHDAYKGWSCCKKKCTDFTEFLNIKGCTTSFHSNEKPEEQPKPVVDKSTRDEVIEVKPKVTEQLQRPPFDTPLTTLDHGIAASLRQQLEQLKVPSKSDVSDGESTEVTDGTLCRHGACKATYPDANSCKYHPGSPIFHEGMKFWSCCNRKTSDFNTFLEQQGCTIGEHQWHKDKSDNRVFCRHDWHQTATHVVVTVFAKKYDPEKSYVKINPIRLVIHLFFPEEDSSFDLDIELRGIIEVPKCSASMYGTKVEISLRKAEAGSWPKLDFPATIAKDQTKKTVSDNKNNVNQLTDLSDLRDL